MKHDGNDNAVYKDLIVFAGFTKTKLKKFDSSVLL
jgi:hypothetical protein